jgi:hypothetical protein
MTYVRLNVNPKGRATDDCVVRAFSVASGRTWEQTLTDLFNISMRLKVMPNAIAAYQLYAKDLGYTRCKVVVVDGHRPTVASFAKANPTGVYILRCANHLTVVVDGAYKDTYDCGGKSVYMYWKAG